MKSTFWEIVGWIFFVFVFMLYFIVGAEAQGYIEGNINNPENSSYNPRNSVTNPDNNQAGKNVLRDDDGEITGYAVEKSDGGLNIYDMDGNRVGWK